MSHDQLSSASYGAPAAPVHPHSPRLPTSAMHAGQRWCPARAHARQLAARLPHQPTHVPPPSHHVVQILEAQPELFFHLQQQRLIELIRQGSTEAALEFAQEYLAPLAEENTAFLEELGECCWSALPRTQPTHVPSAHPSALLGRAELAAACIAGTGTEGCAVP